MKTIPVVLMTSIIALGACGGKKDSEESSAKDKGDPIQGKTPKVETPKDDQATAMASTAIAVDTAGRDALWALAPANTGFGLVAAPGSLSNLHATVLELVRVFDARPAGVDLMANVRAKIADAPFDLLDPKAVASSGLDLDRGLAFFNVGDKRSYGVFPVSDRAAFRKLTKATQETSDGMDVDILKEDMFCTQKEKLYLCASSVADLKTFGNPINSPLAKHVGEFSADHRGAIEVAGDVSQIRANGWTDDDSDIDKVFDSPTTWIVALQQERGAITLRSWVKTKFKGPFDEATKVSSTLRSSVASANPAGVIAFRLPTSLWMDKAEDKVIPGGLNLKTDVLGNLTGELIGYTPTSKTLWGRIEIGVKDAAPFRKLLNMGCGMANAVPGLSSTPGDGTCDLAADMGKIPKVGPSLAKLFSAPIKVRAEVKKDRIQITVGDESEIDTSATTSVIGKALTNRDWNGAFWTEGIALGHALTRVPWNKVPPEAVDGIKLGIWVLSHVHEVGIAAAVRDDGLHAFVRIGTYAGDPQEAYAAYEGAITKIIDGNQSPDELMALGKRWPNTLAGRQGSGVGAGTIMMSSITGVLAAVAIPAFVKYMKRSKEAQDMSEKQRIEMENLTKEMKKLDKPN